MINRKLENGIHVTSDTFLIPNKCIVLIKYIHLMQISCIFWCLCTIIRDSTYATSLKNQLLLWHCYLWVQFCSLYVLDINILQKVLLSCSMWTDRQMAGWTDRQMAGWTDRQMAGWTDRHDKAIFAFCNFVNTLQPVTSLQSQVEKSILWPSLAITCPWICHMPWISSLFKMLW